MENQVDKFVNKNIEKIEEGSYTGTSDNGKYKIKSVSSEQGIRSTIVEVYK